MNLLNSGFSRGIDVSCKTLVSMYAYVYLDY